MLELAIAGALFLLVAGVLGLAVASALGARNEATVRTQLNSDLVQGESNLASGPYNGLLTNTFTPPNACSGTGSGTTGQSCYAVGGQTYKAAWSITAGSDESTSLELTGTATLPSGATVTVSRIVKAPSYEYSSTQGVARISVVNSPAGWNGVGPVYLLEQNNPSIVVASGTVTNGVAVLSGNPASCTLANPCATGLASGNSFATNGIVTEIPSEVWGSGSGVVLTAGGLTDATMTLTGIGTATLNLNATNTNTGQTSANGVAGSVCLYVNFNDGVAQQSVPVCNFASAGSLTISDYAPDPSNPNTRMPIPVGATLSFSTDSANGGCPFVQNTGATGPQGTQGMTDAGWQNEAVCTSWTWGNPLNATISGVSTAWGSASLTLTSGNTVTGSIDWKGPGLGSSVFVADSSNNKVRLITPGGSVSTWAGSGAVGLVNGAASGAEFDNPEGVAVSGDGTVYVADTGNSVIRAITPGGVVSTLATGFSSPTSVALDSSGAYLYVADTGHNQIDKVNVTTGAVTVVAGDGAVGYANGSGVSARFNAPEGVAYYNGIIYVADTGNNRIRAIASNGTVSNYAGTGVVGSTNGASASAKFSAPGGVAVDSSGNVLVSDTGNNEIREISTSGDVSTFSGQASPGLVNGSAGSAEFAGPLQISVGLGGIIYVADSGNNVVRALTSSGVASTLAGTDGVGSHDGTTGTATFSGDSGVASGLGWVSGQPAIGYGTVAVWSGPRFIQSCAESGTCTGLGGGVPENTNCPGQACYSGTAPRSAGLLGQIRSYGSRARRQVVEF